MTEIQPLIFEDITIDVPWGHIAGRWYGNRKVRPILAIHGWQDNLGTWDRLVHLMPHHVGILCIDLPGHGRSSKYPLGITYNMLDYVQIIVQIVKEYKWRKVSLMGHSMGAVLCFTYAALYPHMIDMIIQFDMIKARYHPLKVQIDTIRKTADKLLLENERLIEMVVKEPPSYTLNELEDILYKGSGKSVEKENCKYLLSRRSEKSKLYPNKHYFSQDGRIKLYVKLSGEHGLALEMAKRIRNVPYMIIRSEKHSFMSPEDEELVDLLRTNNTHFEYYRVDGTHHFHLNNAEEIIKWVKPFILKHRPLILDSWSLNENVEGVNKSVKKSKL